MTDKKKEIRDDEFRVIGARGGGKPKGFMGPRGVLLVAALVLLLLIGLLLVLKLTKHKPDYREDGVFDPVGYSAIMELTPLGQTTDSTWTEHLDTIVNDVRLSVYIPHNSIPELTLGVPSKDGMILAAQAADIRADNKKILGAFVLKGKPLAWGLSKKGYCAIIDGIVSVGVSENSPLFEEATEKEGYFFRQYPLVDNGTLVENEPKNKTTRKALCVRARQHFVVVSETDESFHDFAQALVDLGVENAVYLVGGHGSAGWWLDSEGNLSPFDEITRSGNFKNETYIVWRKK